MYMCESWTTKKAECQRIDAFKLLGPLDFKEIKPVNPKEINREYSLESLMLKLKLQYFGHLTQSQLTGKDSDAGKDWRQKEKRRAENEMVGWHIQPNGYEFEQTLGDSERQGSLPYFSPWGCIKSDTA